MSLSASAKTSPVKTEGGFPGESSPGKAPESSPKRSDRLFENPIPDFKPSTEYSMSGKQENQPENSPSTSPSDPGLQAGSYESSGQAFPSQAISMTDAPVLGPCAGSPLQYGSNVQLTDVFTVAQTECTGSKSPDSLDQAYSLGEQGSAELSPTQHQPPRYRIALKPAHHPRRPSRHQRTRLLAYQVRLRLSLRLRHLDSHGFPCSAPDCNKRCSLWDGRSVICPKCGPFSETRYCSRAPARRCKVALGVLWTTGFCASVP